MRFRGIRIAFPQEEHGAVDCTLGQGDDSWDCQCKTGFRTKGRNGFRVALSCRGGAPYSVGDFEMLVVHIPGDAANKFFIPASELKHHGFLMSDQDAGKRTLTVFADRNHWTRQFLR